LVSVCIPAYNESEVVDALSGRLAAVADALAASFDFEFIVCENGSQDDTYEKLRSARERDARLKIVRLARNAHMEGGVTAALAYARGDCAIIMNADLQDPPEYVPALLEKWREGYDNVYCIVTKRSGESALRSFLAAAYYWLMSWAGQSRAPRGVSDFRLVDRVMYEAYLRMPERFRVMRYMWPWLGFRSAGIETERPPRAGGSSKFHLFKTVRDAFRHVFVQSRSPLVLTPIVGLASAALSFALLVLSVVRALVYGVPFNGFGTIVALLLLLSGGLFVCLWMVSEYVGIIFEEVRGRPLFLVAETRGFDDERSARRRDAVSVAGPR